MRLSDERGMTLVELAVGMAIGLMVLAGTLSTFDGFNRNTKENDDRNDATEVARTTLDVEMRQLRNLAKRVASPVIDTLGPYDLIFQTSDPAKTWVRYCLNTTTAPASTSRGRLWTGELAVASASTASPVSAAMRTGCPGTGWTRTSVVADYVTNVRNAANRPLFTFSCITGTTCTSSASTYDQVVGVAAQLYVDTVPASGPSEMKVSSGVYLRNQNQAPVAAFVWSRASSSRTITLNAAGTTDYEGRTLDFYWFKQSMPATTAVSCSTPTVTGTFWPRTLWGATGYIGEGITMTYTFPDSDGIAGTNRNIGLIVCDPGDRFDTVGVPPKALVTVPIPT